MKIELEGKIFKDEQSNWWFAEIPFLEVMTQGRTKKHALEMINDAVMELLKDSYSALINKSFYLQVTIYENGIFGMGASNDTLVLALGLRRQRLRSKSTFNASFG